MNEVMVTSPKPCLFPAATDISYVVYGVRFVSFRSLTLSVVIFQIRVFPFFSLMKNPERTAKRPLSSPVFSGSNQDISALLDVMLVAVWFVGLSGNRARKKGDIISISFSGPF